MNEAQKKQMEYMAELFKGAAEGREIETRNDCDLPWARSHVEYLMDAIEGGDSLLCNIHHNNFFRLKPESKMRPMTALELRGKLVRPKDETMFLASYEVTGYDGNSVKLNRNDEKTWYHASELVIVDPATGELSPAEVEVTQ